MIAIILDMSSRVVLTRHIDLDACDSFPVYQLRQFFFQYFLRWIGQYDMEAIVTE